ncbi:MAG: hypothetical protein HC913_22560 [Microscillaceae bacterium]|nr:hypothetical protein [Microscillaceae bacterium]
MVNLGGLFTASGQILKDDAAKQLSAQALDKIYNFQFAEAKNLIAQLEKKYASHPVLPFFRAYLLSWERFPLDKNSPAFSQYDLYMQDAVKKAKILLEKGDEFFTLEGNFFLTMCYGLLALHEAESGDFMQSVGYGKKSYHYMKKGFGLEERYPDMHFATGLYRYYAVQYPETHPIAKPFMAFFPDGNKTRGLWHLARASSIAQFSHTEAKIYLLVIYAKYEQNFLQMVSYTQQLVSRYPQNPFFWVKHCEALAFVGRFAEAELYLAQFQGRTENLYRSARNFILGVVQEKYYKSDDKAAQFYQNVVNAGKYDKRYTIDYFAFAYAGLARIADRRGQIESAKKYYKEAQKITEYESLKAEIEAYLKKKGQ